MVADYYGKPDSEVTGLDDRRLLNYLSIVGTNP